MKKNASRRIAWLGAAALAALTVGFAIQPGATETLRVSELPRHTHIHGLAVDRQDPAKLLIATHHGLFRAGPDGQAERISVVQDFMGFNPHPSDPKTLYASGHPATGGNLGFIASTDQGRTWEQVSPGVKGPVDFHQLTVSAADPSRIYGAYGGLQVSRDAGKTWTLVGPTPDKLIDLAASAKNADVLYAATEAGLLSSRDAGKTWAVVLSGAPVSLVEVTPDGSVYAFIVGRGLVRSADEALAFTTLSENFGGSVLLHLAADPGNPNRLFAATARGGVLTSTDQGRTWATFGASGS
ncbi:F510_1955 family glycosylhydrolase [Microvirga sp. VF16]|uniref:F510_1955 family glycosylhydrolase n=1 Tax=Microvirga sp. VF16 TaxID=2807101 RepID=UPI00193D2630|nr:exo-alpha-sialidase [Microvirga sp. VF16]QRM34705.1 exo-alpha-sialidase [Microvirga sp. VF16]